jgi:hypothetical protein
MGVAVFSGMLGVTFFGLFLTPVFYVLIRRAVRGREKPAGSTPTIAHAVPPSHAIAGAQGTPFGPATPAASGPGGSAPHA